MCSPSCMTILCSSGSVRRRESEVVQGAHCRASFRTSRSSTTPNGLVPHPTKHHASQASYHSLGRHLPIGKKENLPHTLEPQLLFIPQLGGCPYCAGSVTLWGPTLRLPSKIDLRGMVHPNSTHYTTHHTKPTGPCNPSKYTTMF